MTGPTRSGLVVLIVGITVLLFAAPVAGDTGTGESLSIAEKGSISTASTSTANLTIVIENPGPTGPYSAEVRPGNDSLREKIPFTDNVTYTGLEPGTYEFDVYSAVQNPKGEAAWWGNLTVTLDAGEEKKVTFTRYTPYVNNTFTLPKAPRDPAGGPRFHYRDEDDINITAKIHNPDDQSRTVTLKLLADGVGFPVSLIGITVPAGSSETVVLDGGDFESGRKYEVNHRLTTDDYGSTRLTDQTVGIKSIQEFWLHDRMLNVREHNWAYNGSLSPESLAGDELAALGPERLNGSGVKIAFIGSGIDLSNPAINRLDQGNNWINGQMNVKHGYNTAGSGIGEDPSDGYHGMAVAGTVWQFAPNATYYVTKVGGELTPTFFNLIDFEDEFSQAIDHALTHDPDVIVMSMGTQEYPGDQDLADQFSNAVDDNTTVIVSAGNKGPDDFNMYVTSPAYGSEVLAASSIDRDGSIDVSSSPGNSTNIDVDAPHEKPDLAAPDDFLSFGTANIWSGSSFAAPSSAGVIAQLVQHADLQGLNAADLRQVLRDTAIPTTTLNGSEGDDPDSDGDGGITGLENDGGDDDIDGHGRVRPIGAYHELLADDRLPKADVKIHPVNASISSITFQVNLTNTGADADSGSGIYLAIKSGRFATVNSGEFRNAANVTTSGAGVRAYELYTPTGNVTSGNITVAIPSGATIDLQYRGWLFDPHDAVYNPYRGRYDRYVARYPTEARYRFTGSRWILDSSGDRLIEGERPPGVSKNPPYNRHVGDNGFTIFNYTNKTTKLDTNRPPTAAFTYSPDNPLVNESISLNASRSHDDGSIVQYEWDTDDDGHYEKTGETVTHTFASLGTYTVGLRINDDDGTTNRTERVITVENALATANFTVSKTHPTENETVIFNASPSFDPDGTIETYSWDFDSDDTSEAIGVEIPHSFAEPGQHTVTLQVTDNIGASNTTQRTIDVNAKPEAVFNVSPPDPTVDDRILFDATNSSDDGTIVTYEWDFDDDGNFEVAQSDPETGHGFSSGGNYSVTLRITDDDGATDTVQKWIPVSEFLLPDRQLRAPHIVPHNNTFNVSIKVRNRGATGTETLWFKLFDNPLDPNRVIERSVSLQGGRSRNVTYTISTTNLTAGAYQQKLFLGADNEYYARNTSRTEIVSIEQRNASIRWHKSIGPPRSSPTPHVARDLIVFGGGEGNITAINASTGKIAWLRDIGCEGVSLSIHTDTIYSTQSCGDVYALDLQTGHRRWNFTFDAYESSYAPPAVHDGTVYVSYSNSSIYALDQSNGSVQWKFRADEDFVAFSQPRIVGTTLYATGNDASVYALNTSSGTKRWSTNLSSTVLEASSYDFAPAIYNGSVYVSTIYDDVLYVVDSETGHLTSEIHTGGSSAPTVHNDSIYVSGPVTLINPKTQSIVWRTNGTGTDIIAPTVSDEMLVVGSEFTIIDSRTGNILSEFSFISGNYEASTAINGSRIYTGALSGRVWAFEYPKQDIEGETPETTCIADAVSGSDDEISLSEIQEAINWWAEGEDVPNTGGERISLTKIQSLINVWAEGLSASCS